MPRVHTVKRARKNYSGYEIKKGDSYYWWKFKFGSKIMSKTYPKPQQLTQSEFLSTIYDIGDRLSVVGVCSDMADIQLEVEEITSDLEILRDETQEKLDNMPDSLQSSSTGELLQERIDGVEDMISELEDVDLEMSEDNLLEDIISSIEEISYSGS